MADDTLPRIRVKLFTKGGGYVGSVDVLPFNQAPDIIFWGTRSFILKPGQEKGRETEYVEAFAWAALTMVEEEP